MFEKSPVDKIAAREIANRRCSDKVKAVAGDMLTDALPTDADVHLFSNVLHDWDEPVVRQLLLKSFDALAPGSLILSTAAPGRRVLGPSDVRGTLLFSERDGTISERGRVSRRDVHPWRRSEGVMAANRIYR